MTEKGTPDVLLLAGMVLVGSMVVMLVATWLMRKLGFLPEDKHE